MGRATSVPPSGHTTLRGMPPLTRSKPALHKKVASARFLAFLGVFAAGSLGLAMRFDLVRSVLLGFDVAALVFLASLVPLFRGPDIAGIRSHARENDANRLVLLIITLAVSVVILFAVQSALSERISPSAATYALVVCTLLLTWLFSNSVFALHYAHLFYLDRNARGGDDRGLDFPCTHEPHYWDFVYFACTIGMTFQTSDVQITSSVLRKVVTFHALGAFVFNIGVMAFAINVLGSGR
jgi:uncharacterized membrane protein